MATADLGTGVFSLKRGTACREAIGQLQSYMGILMAVVLWFVALHAHAEYLGSLSFNPYDPDIISNPYGQYGSRYSPESIHS